MAPTHDLIFTHYDSAGGAELMDRLCDVYADAYGVEPDGEQTTAFRMRATKALECPRYGLLTARDGTQVVGFVFGYALPAGTSWWDGLAPAPAEDFTSEDGTRTFVLTEIEVRRDWQGHGIGRILNNMLLAQRQEERATLATGPQADAAQAIYERWGWQPIGKAPGTPGTYFPEYTLYMLPLRRIDEEG